MSSGVSATVRGPGGWGLPDAILTIADMSGNQVARGTADSDGRVSTCDLPAAVYTAIITAPGHTPVARTATVTGSGLSSLGVVDLARIHGHQLPAQGTWTIDPAHSSVFVTARHLGMSSIRGRFTKFGGTIIVAEKPHDSSVIADIDAASIDTSNSERDEHLRSADFLDVATYPTVRFHSTRLTELDNDRWTLDGELTLNAVTRAIELEMTYLGTNPDPWGGVRAGFHARTELQRADFTINYNMMVRAGIAAIGMTLQVDIDIQAVLQK